MSIFSSGRALMRRGRSGEANVASGSNGWGWGRGLEGKGRTSKKSESGVVVRGGEAHFGGARTL